VSIAPKKSNGKHMYNVTVEQLNEIANQGGWIHELDDIEQEADDDEEAYDHGIDKTSKRIPQDEIAELKKEIAELKRQLEEAKEKSEKPKKKDKSVKSEIKEYVEEPIAKQLQSVDKKEMPNVFKMQKEDVTKVKMISPIGINLAGLCD